MKRKIWMIPKNIRSIPPWKLIQILNIFNSASTDREWDSQVKKMLEHKGLKRDFGSYDKNPGGDRTYKSQLVCLGLIYDDDDKNLQLTKAGRDLVNGHEEPLLILQKLLIKNQYPSVYSIGHNVAISGEVVVKPFLFLLELLQYFETLSTEEMAIAVIYGHNHETAFRNVKNKISELRNGTDFENIIDSPDDIWTVRIKDNPFSDRIAYTKDIANIFQNYLEAARLIDRIKEDGVRVCHLTNLAYELIENSNKDFIETTIENIEASPISFQRRFGAWDGSKDTVKVSDSTKPVKDPEELIIRNEFIEFLSEGIKEDNEYDQFRDKMFQLGFSKDKVNTIIAKLNSQNTSLYEDRFQFISTAGAKHAREFEEAVVKLLRKIGFNAFHTGDFRRPSGSGGYADAYAVNEEGVGYLFDAKASEYYSITHDDLAKACQTYIPNWRELINEHNLQGANSIKLFCYVAGGYKTSGNIEGRLSEIKKNTEVEASALNAWDFFKYVQKNNDCSVEDFIDKVLRGGAISLN